jgi:hypothetical protein
MKWLSLQNSVSKFMAKLFYEIYPGANVIKRFSALSYEFSLYARVFVSGKPLQLKLLFVG